MASSNRQYKDSARFTFSGIICIIVLLFVILLTSCGVTKTTTYNCELMQKGQKCIPDHSCCK